MLQATKWGKAIAQCIKGHRLKSKIAYLYHPTTREKRLNSQAIADAFSCYYSNLYNIQDEKDTHQPSQEEILSFLITYQTPQTSAPSGSIPKRTILYNRN